MTEETKSHRSSHSLCRPLWQFILSTRVPLVCMLTPMLLFFSFGVCNKVTTLVHPDKKCAKCQFVQLSPYKLQTAWKGHRTYFLSPSPRLPRSFSFSRFLYFLSFFPPLFLDFFHSFFSLASSFFFSSLQLACSAFTGRFLFYLRQVSNKRAILQHHHHIVRWYLHHACFSSLPHQVYNGLLVSWIHFVQSLWPLATQLTEPGESHTLTVISSKITCTSVLTYSSRIRVN